jgi:hypothetical protein
MFHNLLLTGLLTITSRPLSIQMQLLDKKLGDQRDRQRQEEKEVKMRSSGWAKGRGGSGTFVEGF